MKTLRKYFFWIIFLIFFTSFLIACNSTIELTGMIKESTTKIEKDETVQGFWVHVSKSADYYMMYVYVPHKDDWALAVTSKKVIKKEHKKDAKHSVGFYHEVGLKGFDKIKVVVRVIKTQVQGYGQSIKITKTFNLN